MAIIKRGGSAFFQGISDYWLRFFADTPLLTDLVTGNQMLIGQNYLDSVTTLLRTRLDDMPIFDKHRWQVLVLSKSSMAILDENGQLKQSFFLPNNIKKFKFLFNKIYAPDRIFEDQFDFEIRDMGEREDKQLVFSSGIDIFNSPNIALRETESGDVEVGMWIPDATIDEEWLFKDYGVLIDPRNNRETSESYRAFIYGLFNYFIKGPTLERMESALNIINDVPVARNNNEIIERIDGRRIITTGSIYELPPTAILRVKEGDVLEAFQPLSDSFIVGDYISHPEWWNGIYLPDTILKSTAAWVVGANNYLIGQNVGDYTYITYDDPSPFVTSGPYPVGYESSELFSDKDGSTHQKHIFYKFDKLLKYHNFFVKYDVSFPVTRDTELLTSVLRKGRPAYTNFVLLPFKALEEERFSAAEFLVVLRTVPLHDTFDNFCPVIGRVIEETNGQTDDGDPIPVVISNDYTNTPKRYFVGGDSQNNALLADWSFSGGWETGDLNNTERRVTKKTRNSWKYLKALHYLNDTEHRASSWMGFPNQEIIPEVTGKRFSGIQIPATGLFNPIPGFAIYLSFTLTQLAFISTERFPLFHQPFFNFSDGDNGWVGHRLSIVKKDIDGVLDRITFEYTILYPDGNSSYINYFYDPISIPLAPDLAPSVINDDNELYNRRLGLLVYFDPIINITSELPDDISTCQRKVRIFLEGTELSLAEEGVGPVNLGVDGTDNTAEIGVNAATEDYFINSMEEMGASRSNLYIGKELYFDTGGSNRVEEYEFKGRIHDVRMYQFSSLLDYGDLPSAVGRTSTRVRNELLRNERILGGLSLGRQSHEVRREVRDRYWQIESILTSQARDLIPEGIWKSRTGLTYNSDYTQRHAEEADGANFNANTEKFVAQGRDVNSVNYWKKLNPFNQIDQSYPDPGIYSNYTAIRADGQMQGLPELGIWDSLNVKRKTSSSLITEYLEGNVIDFTPNSDSELIGRNPFTDLLALDDFSISLSFTLDDAGTGVSMSTPFSNTNAFILFSVFSDTGSYIRGWLTPRDLSGGYGYVVANDIFYSAGALTGGNLDVDTNPTASTVTMTTTAGPVNFEALGVQAGDTVRIIGANQTFSVTATAVSGVTLTFDNTIDIVTKDGIGATVYDLANQGTFGDDAIDDYQSKSIYYTFPFDEYSPDHGSIAYTLHLELMQEGWGPFIIPVTGQADQLMLLPSRTGTIKLTVSYEAGEKIKVIMDSGPSTVPEIRPYATDHLITPVIPVGDLDADNDMVFNLPLIGNSRTWKYDYFETYAFSRALGPISPTINDATDWAHGAIGDDPFPARRNRDIADGPGDDIDGKLIATQFQLYSTNLSARDAYRLGPIASIGDPFFHIGCSPNYMERLDIVVIPNENLANTEFAINLQDNNNVWDDYPPTTEDLIMLPDFTPVVFP